MIPLSAQYLNWMDFYIQRVPFKNFNYYKISQQDLQISQNKLHHSYVSVWS